MLEIKGNKNRGFRVGVGVGVSYCSEEGYI